MCNAGNAHRPHDTTHTHINTGSNVGMQAFQLCAIKSGNNCPRKRHFLDFASPPVLIRKKSFFTKSTVHPLPLASDVALLQLCPGNLLGKEGLRTKTQQTETRNTKQKQKHENTTNAHPHTKYSHVRVHTHAQAQAQTRMGTRGKRTRID